VTLNFLEIVVLYFVEDILKDMAAWVLKNLPRAQEHFVDLGKEICGFEVAFLKTF